MANLATNWIQSKFKLPRSVSAIERDLSNGYILLHVANQCGAIDDDLLATAKDSILPDDIIENFRLLSKALSKINVRVSKDVAINIISELPGAVADVVLKIKRQQESKGTKDPNSAYKEGLATLRPHNFVRESEFRSTLNPYQRFVDDAMKQTLDSGVFKTIDMRCQLNHYETFKYTEDDKIMKAVNEQDKKALEDRTIKRQNELARSHKVMENNRQTIADINVKWKETQQVKKNRQIRDMQFELANREIQNLKKKNAADKHNVEQIDGIDAFEKNLIRNGIGAGEEGGALSTTYEDGLLFLSRIEKLFEKKGPTNDDINNFITQLKSRTKEKRAARYEKLRRKRRMLVEQQAMQAQARAMQSTDQEGLNDFQADEELSAEAIKRREKEAKHKENYEKCKESTAEILKKAAVVIEEFTATTRARYKQTQERKKALESIELGRQEKKTAQRHISTSVCQELVALLISEVFDSIDNDRSHILQAMMTTKPLALASTLVKSKNEETAAGAVDLSPSDIFKSDVWQPFVACAGNLASWGIDSSSSSEESSSLPADASQGDNGQEVAETKAESSTPSKPMLSSKLTRTQTLTDKLKSLLEDLLVGLSGSPSGSSSVVLDSIPYTKEENAQVLAALASKDEASPSTNAIQYLFLLQDGSQHFVDIDSMLEQVTNLFPKSGGIKIDCVTVSKVLDMCLRLKPLLEGKTPITFGPLFDILMNSHSNSPTIQFVCPGDLLTSALSGQALKVTGDLLDVITRVMTPANVAAMDLKKGFQLSALPFNETSFSVLVGEILYLRSYVIDKVKVVDKALYAKCPKITIISLHNPRSGVCHSWDSVAELKVVDWMLRGGFRDGPFPDPADADLAALFTAEGKASKAKKPAKGKDEVFVATNVIRNVIVLSSSQVPVSYEASSNGVASDFEKLGLTKDVEKILYALHYQRVKDADLEKRKKLIKDVDAAIVAYANKVGFKTARLFAFKSLFTSDTFNQDHFVEAALDNEKLIKHAIKGSFEVAEAVLSCLLDWIAAVPDASSASPTAAATSNSAITESDFLSDVCCGKIAQVIDQRRNKLPAPVKMLLLNAIGAKTLDKTELWSVYLALCDSESDMLDSFGNFLMMMGSYFNHVDLCLKASEAKLLTFLKSVDARWQSDCVSTETAIASLMQRRELTEQKRKVMLDDLICRIGNTVDDRHMRALQLLSAAKADTEAVVENTRLFVVSALCDIEEDVYRILNQRKDYVATFCSFLEQWGYSDLPIPIDFSKKSVEMKKNQLKTLITLFKHTDNVESNSNNNNNNNSSSNANIEDNGGSGSSSSSSSSWLPFSKLVSTGADADSYLGLSPMMAAAYTELCCNLVDVSSSIAYSSHFGLGQLVILADQMQVKCTSFIRTRHAYEHKMLNNWSQECYSSSNKSFLSKYYFGVSNDSSFDGIPVPVDSSSCVNFGDFKLSLKTLKALAKSLFSDSFSSQVAKLVDVTNSSPSDAYMENIVHFVASAMELAVVNHSVSFPNSWNSRTRILTLLKSIDGASFASFASGGLDEPSFTRYLRKLILSLMYCHVSCPPPMNYISRMVKLLGVESSGGELYELPNVSSSVFMTVVLNDKKLSKAWWLDDGSRALMSKDATSDAIDGMFSTLIPCYIADKSSQASRAVSVVDMLLDLCRSTPRGSMSVISKLNIKCPDSQDLAYLDGRSRDDIALLPDLSTNSMGLFRAFMLASMIKTPAAGAADDDSGNDNSSSSSDGEIPAATASFSCHSGYDACRGAKVGARQAKWLISKLTTTRNDNTYINNSISSVDSGSNVIELCANSGGDNVSFIRSSKALIVSVISALSASRRIESLDSMDFATVLSENSGVNL